MNVDFLSKNSPHGGGVEPLNKESMLDFCQHLKPTDSRWIQRIQKKWDQLCKPIGSLGWLERCVGKIGAIQETDHPQIFPRALFVFASDNGIVAEGVSQTGQQVTAQVLENMTQKKTTAALFSQRMAVDLFPVDLGAACPYSQELLAPIGWSFSDFLAESKQMEDNAPKVWREKICPQGTANFRRQLAMPPEETLKAITFGLRAAQEASHQRYRLLIGGEMGIGNTTTSTAVSSILLEESPESLTGRGSGLTDEGLCRKREILKEAFQSYSALADDPLAVLSQVGGLDIAALTGLYLGAASVGIPVLLDGLISYTAALVASRLAPVVTDYLIPTHQPREKMTEKILQSLQLNPVLDLDLSLGEGAGALLLIPILEAALQEYEEMPTFNQGQVEAYQRFQN